MSATLLVALGAHLFVGWWVLTTFPSLRAPGSRRRRLAVISMAVVCLIAPVGRLLGVAGWKNVGSSLTAAGTTEWMIVMLSCLPIGVLVLTLRTLPRLWSRPAPVLAENASASAVMTRRQVVECGAGLAVVGATAVTLGWGEAFGRHQFRVEEVVVRLPGLPRALEGYTIAQISDIHAGLFVGDRELEEGLSRVRAMRPDLVVATGDLVDSNADNAAWLARRLADLSPRDGVTAILGNHDYYAGHLRVASAMRAAGIQMLVNEGRLIRPGDGGGFALLGVDDLWGRRSGGVGPDLDRALAMVPLDAPRVLLAHQPNYLAASRGRVGLQLSGHTHGGQINPGFRPADLLMRYVAGRYEEKGTTMWVNRGFGVAGPPARIGAPPEVTKVVLIAG
jgi:predicted MPP superfamily phosphohydrolase